MLPEMSLLRKIPHLCKRYSISHPIYVRDATSQGFEYPDEKFPFTFSIGMIFAILNGSKAEVQACNSSNIQLLTSGRKSIIK
jgi:hypothetical protein